ncbi:glycosyltransferase family 39 protein [Aquihabitans sp. G128]|uniref:glycosyltransferase family 39 protein n=1 Tax=Aquihabitans sp. G128 TaxID=2849779 RepID=UPI001C2489F4|nr:glycosyltransferase family 39 protein [Aquihabitans sp. G128]QXC59287.1 glycosyltransferase family 39 protein [Aquihabitans sp. G128]
MPVPPAPAPAEAPDRRWLVQLGLLVALGVALRAAYVLLVVAHTKPGLDAVWYTLQGGAIGDGKGYVVPTSLFAERTVPTAGFPPVYPAYQAAWQWLFGGGPTSVRLAGVVPGAATVALAGVLGRRALGARAGLLAAAIVAVDPILLAVDGAAMSESATVPLVLAAVVVGHRIATDGVRAGRVVALGLLCGVAALSRQDLLLLLPLVAVPALAWAPDVARLRRVAAGAVVVLLAAVVVVPWAWRNHREVDAFTVSTLSPSSVLAGSNCAQVYGGPDLGSWSFPCVAAVGVPAGAPEAELASAQQHAGLAYARHHAGRLPLVVAARQARVWSLWDPRDLARRDAEESRRYGWQLVARPIEAGMALVGVTGLALLVRRRGRVALLALVPVALVVVTATITYGNPRFASISHPVLALGVAYLVSVGSFRARASR